MGGDEIERNYLKAEVFLFSGEQHPAEAVA